MFKYIYVCVYVCVYKLQVLWVDVTLNGNDKINENKSELNRKNKRDKEFEKKATIITEAESSWFSYLITMAYQISWVI